MTKFFIVLMIVLTFNASAETLKLAIPDIVSENLPELTQRIIQTLQSTGYTIEAQHFPNKRAFIMLTQGKVAIQIIRHVDTEKSFPNLIVINPPVLRIDFLMVTSSKIPEYCNATESDFKTMSVAGVIGGVQKKLSPSKFKKYIELKGILDTLKFVAAQRADITFFPHTSLATLPADLKSTIIICQTNTTTLAMHSLIHKKYKWAVEKIEEAYRKEFSNNQL